jgi:aminomethyltransferase
MPAASPRAASDRRPAIPVAMGYVPTDQAKPGTRFFADVRGTKIPIDVHSLPFTPHRYRKG